MHGEEHPLSGSVTAGDEVEDDEDTSALIPWLDLLNHSSNRPTASARWVPQASVYEVQALCTMEAGEAGLSDAFATFLAAER